MELIDFLPICISTLGAVVAVISLTRSKKKDSAAEGQDKGIITSDIGYIKAGVDDLKSENREARKEREKSNERLTRCEESVKQAHKRIDGLAKYHLPHENHEN